MKIVSWNVNGVRAFIKKSGDAFLGMLDVDIICLQEIKCQKKFLNFNGYKSYWNHSEKKGYAGTVLFSKIEPISVTYKLDCDMKEGRIIVAEYEKYYVINTYFPNSGNNLQRLTERLIWNKAFARYIKTLAKPMILCGDFNVSQTVLDIAEPRKHYNKHPGYTQKELDSFKTIISNNLVDVYRHLYKGSKQYTFYSYLGNNYNRNVGYRCDLFLLSDILINKIKDCKIYTVTRMMKLSDHCAIELEIDDI